MKRRILAALVVCALAFGLNSNAERKKILVSSYTNVLVDETNNYQVNGQGDIVTYSFAKDDLGEITAIYYTYTKKSGKDIIGQIGPGPQNKYDFIPPHSVSFEIVGLERNVALCLFTDSVGSKIYMVFRLANNYGNPTPNRTNPASHVALNDEACSLTNNQILSYRYNPEVVADISRRARTANIAVITISTDYSLNVGDKVTILGSPDPTFNATNVEVLSVFGSENGLSFTYSCPGVDVAEIASSGIVYRPEVFNSLTVYNHSWKAQANKGIDADYGSLSIINLKIQQYYKGVTPTPDPKKFDIYILKP